MSARSFQDSSGTVWEVFEVRRASEAPRGVSEGLEAGWLTFASDSGKRRLAPFPEGWENAPPSELERLCAMAREANVTRFRKEPRPSGRSLITEELAASESTSATGEHRAAKAQPDDPDDPEVAEVRGVVRTFAHEARTEQLSAVEAMLRLKARLADRYGATGGASSLQAIAQDMPRVRRWFVEAFYFENER